MAVSMTIGTSELPRNTGAAFAGQHQVQHDRIEIAGCPDGRASGASPTAVTRSWCISKNFTNRSRFSRSSSTIRICGDWSMGQ